MSLNNIADNEEYSEDFFPNLPSLHINSIPTAQSQVRSSISPEEMVIRSRGRRRFPPPFSPDRMVTPSPVYSRDFPSPPRKSSPPRSSTAGKTTSRLTDAADQVRRQLRFTEEESEEFSILKLIPVVRKTAAQNESSSPHPSEIEFLTKHKIKKPRILSPGAGGDNNPPQQNPLRLAMGLSKNQLVDLLASLIDTDPSIASNLQKLLPKPDLSGLRTHLTYLSQNIYKDIPVSRLSPRTDSMAYNRVSVHLSAFKKSLLEDLAMLLEAGQWASVLEYVIMAWEIVQATPIWANPIHNTSRNSCFKHMAISIARVMNQQNYTIPSDTSLKLINLMIGSQVREVQLCCKKLLAGKGFE